MGRHVAGASTRAELSVLGAAPGALLGWVQHVFTGSEGLTVTMRDGLSIYFGNATRAHAKWLAAARVLADPSSAGATYIDVRLPERPAAGTTAAGGLAGSAAAHSAGQRDPTRRRRRSRRRSTKRSPAVRARRRRRAARVRHRARHRARRPARRARVLAKRRLHRVKQGPVPVRTKPRRALLRRARRQKPQRRRALLRMAPQSHRPNPRPRLQVDGNPKRFLGRWLRVRGSARDPAKVVGDVDRAKFPA